MVETHYNIKNAPRIALLADFHNGNPEPIISSLRRHDINLIAIAGDMVYGRPGGDDKSPLDTQKNVTALLASCASIAPTYMSLGNHEWMLNESDLDRITSTGVVVLDNGWIETDIKTHDNEPVTVSLRPVNHDAFSPFREFSKQNLRYEVEYYPQRLSRTQTVGPIDVTTPHQSDTHSLLSPSSKIPLVSSRFLCYSMVELL